MKSAATTTKAKDTKEGESRIENQSDSRCGRICYTTMTADMGQLQHKCKRLRLFATCLITNKHHIVINYDYIESNCDHICFETSSKKTKPICMV